MGGLAASLGSAAVAAAPVVAEIAAVAATGYPFIKGFNFPYVFVTFPVTFNKGPAAAAIPAILIMHNEMLEAMQGSAGATQEAFDKMDATPSEKLKGALNELKNSAIKSVTDPNISLILFPFFLA